nr:hypothetical protein [uncultured Flavobacterium sp.]
MIDFVRLYYRDKSNLEYFLLDKQNFDTVNTVMEYHTGEIKYPYTAKLDTMDVGVSDRSGYVKNSLHKLYNYREYSEEHNYNDFGFSKVCAEVDFLSEKIIDAGRTKLTQLEFGFNIEIDNLPEMLVRRNFLMHKYEGGSGNNYQGKGELKKFSHDNYLIKVYDKGKQYGLEENILRFEIKFIKAKEFQTLGVFNLHDLKVKSNLRRLFIYLIKRFDEMTIIDDFDETSISLLQDYHKLSIYKDPIYWTEEIKGIHSQKRARMKVEFNELLNKYDLLKTKAYLRQLLLKKFIYLINQ